MLFMLSRFLCFCFPAVEWNRESSVMSGCFQTIGREILFPDIAQ